MYYIDNKDNTDPWLNLALEEYTVRNLDKNFDYLLLYVNRPSLIIGKHQNVLEEVNLAIAGENNIPIIRRISGGGAVYHDTGNLNISVVTNQTLKNFNKYSSFLKPILEVLEELLLPVRLNERNNIFLGDKKISGNAQFTSKQRLLSHGTLLVHSDLTIIDRITKSENQSTFVSKSTKSIRSIVTNINNYLKNNHTVNDIKKRILNKIYGNNIKYFNLSTDDWKAIRKLSETKYKSWQWNYGLSPSSQITKKFKSEFGDISMDMVVDKGLIQSIELVNPALSESINSGICRYLINQQFDFPTIKSITEKIKNDSSLSSLNTMPWLNILLN